MFYSDASLSKCSLLLFSFSRTLSQEFQNSPPELLTINLAPCESVGTIKFVLLLTFQLDYVCRSFFHDKQIIPEDTFETQSLRPLLFSVLFCETSICLFEAQQDFTTSSFPAHLELRINTMSLRCCFALAKKFLHESHLWNRPFRF